MLFLIQSLKVVFLFFTTLITVFYFLKNYRLGITVYLILMIISGLLGFSRAVFEEEILLLIFILVSILNQESISRKKIFLIPLFLVLYTIVLTIIRKEASFFGSDFIFIMGFIMLTFANYLFGDDKYVIRTLILFWLYELSKTIWLIIHGSFSSLFSFVDPVNGLSRLLQIDTGLSGSAGTLSLDPNYLAVSMGLGVVLSLQFLIYREYLYKYIPYKFVRKRWFIVLLLFITAIEFWFMIRGLSRGAILAIIAAFLSYLFLERKIKIVVFSSLFLIFAYLIFSGVFELFLIRFGGDNTAGGRMIIWGFIWNYMVDHGTIWFGSGLNFHWAKYWFIAGEEALGTHNSWVSILLIVGLFGLLFLVILISISFYKNYKTKTVVSKIKIILLSYIVVSNGSIGLLYNVSEWILFVLCLSYNINMKIYENNRFFKTGK